MHRMRTHGFRIVIAILMIGMSTSSAWAYLDPGTGSIILQVLLGGVAGLLLAGKLYWHKILTALGIRHDAVESHTARDRQVVDAPTRE
jgi:hypothetical protein